MNFETKAICLFCAGRRFPVFLRVVWAGLLAGGLIGVAWAQPPAPEGWPCIQRYQPSVSAGAFWPYELLEDVHWNEEPQVRDLADAVTERAMPLEEAREEIRAFLESQEQDTGKDLQKTASLLIAALDEMINSKRDRIIEGIARFSARQQMMISRIETQGRKIDELKAAADPDAAALEDLETRQKWDVRVFDEREDLSGHLCEQPVLMEQKFFALGRDVAAYLEEHGEKRGEGSH